MFDEVRGARKHENAFGGGTVISIVAHALVLAVAVWLSLSPRTEKKEDVAVTFFAAPPPPPPPPPPPKSSGGSSKPKVEKKIEKPVHKPETIVQPKEIPTEKPPEAEPEPESDKEDEGVEGGVEGGVAGGVVGGTVGGVIGGQIGGVIGGQLGGQLGGTEALPFGEGMTRPEVVQGPSRPQYTREGREARIQGTMIVQCIITAEGRAQDCKIIKPLPHMERAVTDWVSIVRFKPASYQGKPVTIKYMFNFKFVLTEG